jgi:hypothetical protein
MIAVRVGDQDGADRVWIDAEFSRGDHRRGAAVDEKGAHPILDAEARAEAAAAYEAIARTHKMDLHAASCLILALNSRCWQRRYLETNGPCRPQM